ncbi:MAG: helix-turn-helix transcriptional regulator [Bacteroidales bacterium]|nr:helix-turn-helix transcriptional regulator [Bacteroidales bacterium]
MNSITVVIADRLQITRLGIYSILRQLDYPVNIREISRPEKLFGTPFKNPSNILITSVSFLVHANKTVSGLLEFLMQFTCKIIIHDQEASDGIIAAFNEAIEYNDPEKIILRKIDRQLSFLLQTHPAPRENYEISEREKEVLRLVALGLTNKEIGERLFISSHTVITHRKNISAKLGIKTIAGLTVYAVIHKLIRIDDIHRDSS